jgi:aminoglycoside phosphotransferase family enzyme/predicted kinase
LNNPPLVKALLRVDAYPHPCSAIELIETHISWVFLTGQYAYKVKKPVAFNFVDFSSLERRAHFCREELRCNRAFVPELYDAVVPINLTADGYRIEGSGRTVEWAVRMVQFPSENQLDRLLGADRLSLATMREFGSMLASQHAQLPVRRGVDDAASRVLKPVLDNFRTLAPLAVSAPHVDWLESLRADSETLFAALGEKFAARAPGGFVRECHGDLHLSNLVLTDLGVRAFDCLEFNPDLRWIDVASDVAFLLMDCCVRGREDLSYGFLDGYLTAAGDYSGVVLSPFYQAYRSMVRAKVAALQLAQQQAGDGAEIARRLLTHLQWTDKRLHRPRGGLVLMCGLSGSGKSYLAERLVPVMPAVRLRSDVARKRLAGLAPHADSQSPIDGGLYTRDRTEQVYARLQSWAADIACGGEHVIVDATFLQRHQRSAFVQLAARLQIGCTIVYCHADRQVLEQRLRRRAQEGNDVSEAGIGVLQRQLEQFEDFADEPVMRLNTAHDLQPAAIAEKLREATPA